MPVSLDSTWRLFHQQLPCVATSGLDPNYLLLLSSAAVHGYSFLVSHMLKFLEHS